MPFDPAKAKEIAMGPRGYARCLNRDFQKSKALGGLASCACADMNEAVICLLVNVDEPAKMLLERAQQWLTIAIAENERPQHYFPEGTEALRLLNLAKCRWLLHGHHDEKSLSGYVEYRDRYFANRPTKDRVAVGIAMAGYLDAAAFDHAMRLLESAQLLTPPRSPARTSGEAQMAYVLSKHALEQTYSEEEVRQATKSFLSRNVGRWLSSGDYDGAANWLKILLWNDTDRTATAKEIVMKCYDYLPCRPPE